MLSQKSNKMGSNMRNKVPNFVRAEILPSPSCKILGWNLIQTASRWLKIRMKLRRPFEKWRNVWKCWTRCNSNKKEVFTDNRNPLIRTRETSRLIKIKSLTKDKFNKIRIKGFKFFDLRFSIRPFSIQPH